MVSFLIYAQLLYCLDTEIKIIVIVQAQVRLIQIYLIILEDEWNYCHE